MMDLHDKKCISSFGIILSESNAVRSSESAFSSSQLTILMTSPFLMGVTLKSPGRAQETWKREIYRTVELFLSEINWYYLPNH